MNEEEFKNHLKKYLDEENINKLYLEIQKDEDISSFVFDEDKISKETLLSIYPNLKQHADVKNAFIFNKEDELGKSLLFEIGAFYILEPCSSLVSTILNPQEDDLVLDCCAAPGGKTIHTSFLMHNKGQIIANEINIQRANVLSSNVEKYGRKNVTVISSSLDKLANKFKNTFTKVILDAPCSGSGMAKKEKKMGEDWTLNKVLSLVPLQKELILEAYSMLKEGGEMVYSTCSFSYEEDEEVIEYLLNNTDAELVDIEEIKGAYKSSKNIGIHLLPHLYNGDGHYICKIKKPGTLNKNYSQSNIKINKKISSLYELGEVYITSSKDVYLTNKILDLSSFRILRNGIKCGVLDDKLGLVYDHNFSRIDLGILPKIELDENEAKNYIFGNTLNKEAINGYNVLTFKNIPFALTKVTKNVLKNHYPKGLRKKINIL